MNLWSCLILTHFKIEHQIHSLDTYPDSSCLINEYPFVLASWPKICAFHVLKVIHILINRIKIEPCPLVNWLYYPFFLYLPVVLYWRTKGLIPVSRVSDPDPHWIRIFESLDLDPHFFLFLDLDPDPHPHFDPDPKIFSHFFHIKKHSFLPKIKLQIRKYFTS